jgi:putative transposase
MRETGKSNSNVRNSQFWQQNNHPIELWSNKVIDQKLEYIHENPVTAGFVEKPEDWRLSSAMDYCGRQGLVQIEKL